MAPPITALDSLQTIPIKAAAATIFPALTASFRRCSPASLRCNRASNTTEPKSATAAVESANPACPIPAHFTMPYEAAKLTTMDAMLTSMGVRASSRA